MIFLLPTLFFGYLSLPLIVTSIATRGLRRTIKNIIVLAVMAILVFLIVLSCSYKGISTFSPILDVTLPLSVFWGTSTVVTLIVITILKHKIKQKITLPLISYTIFIGLHFVLVPVIDMFEPRQNFIPERIHQMEYSSGPFLRDFGREKNSYVCDKCIATKSREEPSDKTKNQQTLDNFKALKIGMSYTEVEQIVGKPDTWGRPDIYIFKYILPDNSLILLGFRNLDSLFYVKHITPEGIEEYILPDEGDK